MHTELHAVRSARRSLTVVLHGPRKEGWDEGVAGNVVRGANLFLLGRRDNTAAVEWKGSVGSEQSQRRLARGAAATIGKRRRLPVGEACCMKVMDAGGGGYGFHAENRSLANRAGFIPCVGLPQLEHAMPGEPVDLADFQGIVLGAAEQ